MKTTKYVAISLVIVFLAAGVTLAQDPVVYPAKGQSQDQMEKDKYECYSWAKKESGFDPMQQPKATAPPPPQEAQGGAGRGAARGAATGAVVGKIAKDDAGKGAAIGAASGAVVGGARRRDQNRQQQQAQQQYAQQQSAAYTKNRDAYNRAYGACLEGRGYSVK
ncbi:YMGG-like glycine zipper-containing protein [Thermodesulfobacteriota bacterium]